MKASDLREKSVDDLRELQKSLAHDVFQNRIKNFTNRLDDTSLMRKTKKDLARVVTVLRESALGIARKGAPEGAKADEAPSAPKAPKAQAKAASEDKPRKAPAKKAASKATKTGEAK